MTRKALYKEKTFTIYVCTLELCSNHILRSTMRSQPCEIIEYTVILIMDTGWHT